MNINQFVPILIVITPLVCAFFVMGLHWVDRRLCLPLTVVALLISFVSSIITLYSVISHGIIQYKLGGWPPPIGIEYRIDTLNGSILVLVTSVALINIFASFNQVSASLPEKKGTFYSLYLLFVTGLVGVVITGDLFNLYVLLEITSLSAYGQIALGDRRRAPIASLNYIFIGVIGASFYLLGVGYLYIMTGSLNMADVANIIQKLHNSQAIFVAFIFCMVGVWIKMALFPLHIWLPNAYTYAPTTSSRLIAPLMTKVMVYVMIRLMFTVFGYDYLFKTLHLSNKVVFLASFAIIFGALMALSQKNLKKMLTYIIISEIGYMVGGAWIGNRAAITGSILHIINDAFMTFGLFIAAGNFAWRIKELDIDDLKDIFSTMPWTSAGFVIAGMSIIGIPPTCGFFSKWYLLIGAISAKQYFFAISLILSSLFSVILFFRVFEKSLFNLNGLHSTEGSHAATIQEAPLNMVIGLLFVCVILIALGLYSGEIVSRIIDPFVLRGI